MDGGVIIIPLPYLTLDAKDLNTMHSLSFSFVEAFYLMINTSVFVHILVAPVVGCSHIVSRNMVVHFNSSNSFSLSN
jgi:hypothetical protein